MTFALRVTNENSIAEIDPTYFSIVITNEVVNTSSHEVISLDTKMTKICEANDFPDPAYFTDNSITNAICTDGNNTFDIGGFWTDPVLSYVRIVMMPCQNGTDNGVVCKSANDIKKYFKNRFLVLILIICSLIKFIDPFIFITKTGPSICTTTKTPSRPTMILSIK